MMKSKRAKEFIRNSAFSAIQLPGEVMYSIHMNVEGKLLDRKSAERAVELAERDAEKKIEALKARAVRAFLMACSCGRDICSYRAEGVGCTDYLRGHGCSQYSVFIQKLNER